MPCQLETLGDRRQCFCEPCAGHHDDLASKLWQVFWSPIGSHDGFSSYYRRSRYIGTFNELMIASLRTELKAILFIQHCSDLTHITIMMCLLIHRSLIPLGFVCGSNYTAG